MNADGAPVARWHRPVRGGLAVCVTTEVEPPSRPAQTVVPLRHRADVVAGTIGAVVRGRLPDDRTLMLSTGHVLWPQGSGRGHVWQPAPCGTTGCDCDRVGIAVRRRHGIVVHDGHRYFVDCAVAAVDSDVPWQPGVAGAPIAGVARARSGTRVWKVGAGSGHSTGVVVDDAHVERGGNGPAPNQLLIRPLPGNPGPHGVDRFSGAGDSGALVLDEAGRAVGLLWAASLSGESVACHIEPVLDALAVDIAGAGCQVEAA